MAIRQPIYIVAHPRSGTTLTYNILAHHPHLAWISSYVERFPERPKMAVLSRIYDAPLFPAALEYRYPLPSPAEAIDFYTHYFPGYASTERDWTEKDAEPEKAARLLSKIELIIRWQGKKRFLSKRTGMPMIGFIRAMMPDVKIILLQRDPRAVVASMYKQLFSKYPEATRKVIPSEYLQYFTEKYLNQYKFYRQFDKDPNLLRVNYEDLTRAPMDTFAEICEFTELPLLPAFQKHIQEQKFEIYDHKRWRQFLPPELGDTLDKALEGPTHMHFAHLNQSSS
jgi:hypothetical protein